MQGCTLGEKTAYRGRKALDRGDFSALYAGDLSCYNVW